MGFLCLVFQFVGTFNGVRVCLEIKSLCKYSVVFVGLSLSTGQDINLSQASGENSISPETVKDKWWYILQPNGGEKKIVYCNGTKCSSILCSEYKTRMEINGLSLILKKVRLADERLRVQCKIWRKNHAAPLLFNVLLKHVSANPRTGQSLSFCQRLWSSLSPLIPLL